MGSKLPNITHVTVPSLYGASCYPLAVGLAVGDTSVEYDMLCCRDYAMCVGGPHASR